MAVINYYSQCLPEQKTLYIYISCFLGAIAIICFGYNATQKLYEVSINNHTFAFHTLNSQKSDVTFHYEQRTILLKDKCGNKSIFSTRKISDLTHYDKALNYLGFVVRYHSFFYCAVPKVATRTLLTYITYLHIRDELITAFENHSVSYFNGNRNLFNMDYLNKLLSTSIKNDSVLLLSHLIKAIKLNWNQKYMWLMFQNGVFPYMRLRTLSNPSLLFTNSFIRAIFVRHPLERLASAYVNKIARLHSKPNSFYGSMRRRICQKYVVEYLTIAQQQFYANNMSQRYIDELCRKQVPTFEHFIKYLMSETAQVDVHWLPYSSLCNVCAFKYNFIGKYETIEDDLNFIRLKLGFNSSDWNMQNHFSTGKTERSYKLMYSNLSNDLLCNLKDFYKEDFTYFNYRLNDYLINGEDIHCSPRFYRRFPIII